MIFRHSPGKYFYTKMQCSILQIDGVNLMKKELLYFPLAFALQGCATDPSSPDYPISQSDVHAQTYTYVDLDGSKDELWKKARNYIASAYGDSKAVLRVEDENSGTLIGKGIIKWKMLTSSLSPYCYSEYDIRFVSKDNKARLQLELLAGVPSISECVAWPLPSKYGYQQITDKFLQISSELEISLRGKGKLESINDF